MREHAVQRSHSVFNQSCSIKHHFVPSYCALGALTGANFKIYPGSLYFKIQSDQFIVISRFLWDP